MLNTLTLKLLARSLLRWLELNQKWIPLQKHNNYYFNIKSSLLSSFKNIICLKIHALSHSFPQLHTEFEFKVSKFMTTSFLQATKDPPLTQSFFSWNTNPSQVSNSHHIFINSHKKKINFTKNREATEVFTKEETIIISQRKPNPVFLLRFLAQIQDLTLFQWTQHSLVPNPVVHKWKPIITK